LKTVVFENKIVCELVIVQFIKTLPQLKTESHVVFPLDNNKKSFVKRDRYCVSCIL